ncbi:MAG: 3-deoxy-D-manno-octulosonic acid transferase [bacterium]
MGIYNILLWLGILLYSPVILWRGLGRREYRHSLPLRLGFRQRFSGRSGVWFHAVSVGETEALVSLVKAFHEAHPQAEIIFSTTTETGQELARKRLGELAEIIYFPIDFSFLMRRLIESISPRLVVLAETEFWPNFLREVSKRKIPVLLVNGRISDKSYKGYRRFKFFFEPLLAGISLLSMQSEEDKIRITGIGAKEERVEVGNNLKFDRPFPSYGEKELKGLRESIGFPTEAPLFIGGSTHPGEEEIIIKTYAGLLSAFPELKLIIAPRKPHRAAEIEKSARGANLTCARRSDSSRKPVSLVILDTIGELTRFYALSDIVFVGGSLVPHGGQNILEPAACSKPVLFGPHMQNFRDIAGALKNNGGIQVNNQKELERETARLLKNPAYRKRVGKQARQVVMKNRGAVKKNLKFMEALLFNRETGEAE